MTKKKQIWKDTPESHDYPAAQTYLSLVFRPALASALVKKLRHAKTVQYAAKDLLRASQLPLLEQNNSHVAGDLRKLRKGKPLSPVLLVRGDALLDLPLVVADGYHRICASLYLDEDVLISCRLVDRR